MMHSAWRTILFSACLSAASAQSDSATRIDAGPLQIDLYLSQTAQVFHIVDQVSEWSEFSHRQYGRYFRASDGLSEDERKALAEHSSIRKKYGWGHGPEQAFYTPLTLEAALTQAVENGYLTESEAAVERRVFSVFRPRVERLINDSLSVLKGFVAELSDRQSDLTAVANEVASFVGATPGRAIPCYLIANPDDASIGGGYNGDFLTLEIPRNRDAYPTFLHEILHAFVDKQRPMLEEAVGQVPGLTFETLNEGLAYAFSPGIHHTGDGDPLRQQVSTYLARGTSMNDSCARFNLYALALRPLLKDALNRGERLPAFLPRALDAWRAVTEIDQARPSTAVTK
jgi:hypothetical protein